MNITFIHIFTTDGTCVCGRTCAVERSNSISAGATILAGHEEITLINFRRAVGACESLSTCAGVSAAFEGYTCAPTCTRCSKQANVNHYTTVRARDPRIADTHESRVLRNTCTMYAGTLAAFILPDGLLTLCPNIEAYTCAIVAVYMVLTLAPVEAWVRITLIDVHLAVLPSVARDALTRGQCYGILACGSVETRINIRCAEVNVHLTELSCKTSLASTCIGVYSINTRSIDTAVCGAAVIYVDLTENTTVTHGTGTVECIDTIHTRSTILTGYAGTVVNVSLAVLSGETIHTVT